MTLRPKEIELEAFPHCDVAPILAKIRSFLDVGHLDLDAAYRKRDPYNEGVMPAFAFRSVLMGEAKGLRVTYVDVLLLSEMCPAKELGLVNYSDFIDLLYKEGQRHLSVGMHFDAYVKHIMDEIAARLIYLGHTFETVSSKHLRRTRHLIHANMLFSVLHKLGVYIQEKDFVPIVTKYEVGGMLLHKKTLFRDFKISELSLTDKDFKRLEEDDRKGIMEVPDFPPTSWIEGVELEFQKNLESINNRFMETAINFKKDYVRTIIRRIQKLIYLRPISPAIYFKDDLFSEWQKKIRGIPDYPVQKEKHYLYGVLEKVKDALVQHKFKLEYFFEEFDPNRGFVLDRHMFVQAMKNSMDFPLSLKEYNILMDAFCDLDDKNKIYYKDFLRVMFEAEYFQDLKKNPLLFPLPHVANRFRREFKYSKQEMDAIREIWHKISIKMHGYREWEKAKSALIPNDLKTWKTHDLSENYKWILSLLDIEHLLTDYEVEFLYDAYKIPVDGKEQWDLEYFLRSGDQMYLTTYNLE